MGTLFGEEEGSYLKVSHTFHQGIWQCNTHAVLIIGVGVSGKTVSNFMKTLASVALFPRHGREGQKEKLNSASLSLEFEGNVVPKNIKCKKD